MTWSAELDCEGCEDGRDQPVMSSGEADRPRGGGGRRGVGEGEIAGLLKRKGDVTAPPLGEVLLLSRPIEEGQVNQ